MRLVRLLPDRWQKLIHEVLKFGTVGGINTVLNYAVFNALALTVFTDGQLKATVVATVIATISSYLMNRYWTYRDRPRSTMRRESALFMLFNLAGLLIELGILALVKYGLDMTGLLALNAAKTVGILLGTAFRFWTYRSFVFRPAVGKPAKVAAVTPEPATVAVHHLDRGTVADTDGEDSLIPLDPALIDAADVTLEAELALELDAGHRVTAR